MRTFVMATALSVMGVAAPSAQTAAPAAAAPAAPLGAPRAYQGYSQPDITSAYCRTVNPGQTTCTLPAMSAGRYLLKASGTSTATGAGASQKITLVIGAHRCGIAERKPTPQVPWPTGVSKTIRLNCEITVLTDRPLPVTAVYADDKANKLTTGPTLTVERLAWEGLTSVEVAPVRQDP